jgi:hypothetical protein
MAFALYGATGARDVQWGDPAKLTLYVWRFNLSLDQDAHLGALVWAWPFSWLPVHPFAFRVTLASVVASALTAGFLHSSLLKCFHSPWAARIGTAAFVLSHTFWFVSTIPESYPVSLLAIAVAGWFVVSGRSVLRAGIALGAGAFSNALTLFAVPAAIWWLWQRDDRNAGHVWRFLVGVMAGLGIPVLLAISFLAAPVASASADWLRVLRSYTNWRTPLTNLPLFIAYFVYNFAGPALLLMAIGFKSIGREQRVAFVLFAVAYYAFGLFYLPQRSYLIPIPVYLAAAWLVGAGSDELLRGRSRASWPLFTSVAAAPIVIYMAAPVLVEGVTLPGVVRDAPFRNEVMFYMRPWKQFEDSARRYIQALDRAIPDGAAVVGDFTIMMPLVYANRVEGWKPTCRWEIVDGQSSENVVAAIAADLAQGRRVFLLDDKPYYFTSQIRKRWKLAPAGVESLLEVTSARKPLLKHVAKSTDQPCEVRVRARSACGLSFLNEEWGLPHMLSILRLT